MLPSGSCLSPGTPSGREVSVAGILNSIQWKYGSKRFAGAYSSSLIKRTKLCVPGGAPVQERGGETAVVDAYFSGIGAPSANAVVLRIKREGAGAGRAGGVAACGAVCALAVATIIKVVKTTEIERS